MGQSKELETGGATHSKMIKTTCQLCHLSCGMNTGIGTTGTLDLHRMGGNLGERLLQLLLHAVDFPLTLPAKVTAAIVFNSQCYAHIFSTLRLKVGDYTG